MGGCSCLWHLLSFNSARLTGCQTFKNTSCQSFLPVRVKCPASFHQRFVFLWFVCSILNCRKNNLATVTCNPVYLNNVIPLWRDIMFACPSRPSLEGIWYFYDVIRCVLWFHNGVSCSIFNGAIHLEPLLIVWLLYYVKSPLGKSIWHVLLLPFITQRVKALDHC